MYIDYLPENKAEVNILNRMLEMLVENRKIFVEDSELAQYDSNLIEKLKLVLINSGYASENYSGTLCSTNSTKSASKLNSFDKLYQQYIDEKQRKEKTELEIQSLKKSVKLIKPAFWAGIISGVIAVFSLIAQISNLL